MDRKEITLGRKVGRKENTLGRKEIHWAGRKIHTKVSKKRTEWA